MNPVRVPPYHPPAMIFIDRSTSTPYKGDLRPVRKKRHALYLSSAEGMERRVNPGKEGTLFLARATLEEVSGLNGEGYRFKRG